MTTSAFTPLVFAAVTLFTAMMAIGWKLADRPPQATQAGPTNERIPNGGTDRQSRSTGAGIPDHVRRQMNAIRATNSPAERMRLTLDLVNSIPIDEIHRWIDGGWFDLRSGFDMTLFTTLINRRWEDEDPEGMIGWSLKNPDDHRGQLLLMKWSQDDPQRLFAFFASNPDAGAESRLLPEIAKAHPTLALARLQELLSTGQISAEYNGYLEQTILQLAAKSPAELLAALDSLPAAWHSKVESALTGERMKKDFAGEIKLLWERPDGFAIFSAGIRGVEGFRDKVLAEIHNMPASWIQLIAANSYNYIDAKNAPQWIAIDFEALGLSADRASSLRRNALGQMAYGNAEEMLKLMGTLEIEETQRKHLIMTAFSNTRSTEEAERMAALLPPEERAMALGIQEARNQVLQGNKIDKPSEWLEKLQLAYENMIPGNADSLISTVESWDSTKLAELTKQFANLPANQKDQVASLLLHSNIDRGLKGEMIRHVAMQPDRPGTVHDSSDPFSKSNFITNIASSHVVQWAQQDPEAASQWVRTLPQGEAKLWAQKNLASNWALYDPEAANAWVKSLPADARQEVRAFMDGGK